MVAETTDEMTTSVVTDQLQKPVGTLSARNGGQPIYLTGVNVSGVVLNPVRRNERFDLWTRLAMTSDDPVFHHVVKNLNAVIVERVQQAGQAVNLDGANTVLLIVRPDQSAELWVDSAAMALVVRLNRSTDVGAVLFNEDITDIVGMMFPLVEIGPSDKIMCLFRQAWRFGLYFDFREQVDDRLETSKRELGRLYRNLAYRHLYEAVANAGVFNSMLAAGWFPFVEIIHGEFDGLAQACEAGFELTEVEARLLAAFSRERVERMMARWMLKPHFAHKEPLFRAALEDFLAGRAISAIKNLLTEIEGVVGAAHRAETGEGARLKKLLAFVENSAIRKAGGNDTLLFPVAFTAYLAKYTFADFDPSGPPANAGSRHAVGHGAATADSYTMTRALQALLTLDQIAFYT
jgi:hypothetical protein